MMLRLLLLQVLVSCLWLGHSEVFNDFSSCLKFFYEKTPPNNVLEPTNPAWICQRYRNQYHFATLYDKTLRIPVYSAYIYQPASGNKSNWWFVEPQLIQGKHNLKEMEKITTLVQQYHYTLSDIEKNQAITDDYKNLTGLNRGHLSPSGHHTRFPSRAATFTLTNIVPQDSSLNDGAWKYYEVQMMITQTKGCTTTYVITGAVPGTATIKNRVNVPSHIWSAACCVVGGGKPKAWGVIATNNKNNQKRLPVLTLGQLETDLTQLYGGGKVSLFHSDCPR